MKFPEPQKEHELLQKMVGDWTFEAEGTCGPGESPQKFKGTESVRALGGFWTIGEGQGEMPGGGTGCNIMTLGYDPAKKRFVGTWVGSMMPNLWVYDGALDASGRRIDLDAEGPSMAAEGAVAKYRDSIEFVGDDHRTLTSHMLDDNGKWVPFMTARYHRKK